MEFYTRYNHEKGKTHDFSKTNPKAESLTLQSFKDSADVNLIIKKYTLTGEMPTNVFDEARLQYLDNSIFPDFQTAMDSVVAVRESFMNLPANVRKAFGNDPGELYSAFMSGERDDELIKYGLKEKSKPVNTQPVTTIEPIETNSVSNSGSNAVSNVGSEGVGTIAP